MRVCQRCCRCSSHRLNTRGDWEKIGEEKGEGNSQTVLSYSWVDENPLSGVNYYRLKQIDFDGRFEYSQERAVNFGVTEIMSVYPNPATNIATVEIGGSSNRTNAYVVEIVNPQGVVVLQYASKEGGKDGQVYTFDVSALSQGAYTVRYISANRVEVKKLVIVK